MTPPFDPTKPYSKDNRAPQRVVCAALRRKLDGLIICGPRHFDSTMRALIQMIGGRESWLDCDDGFINQFGEFLTREEAHVIATEQKQLHRRCGGDKTRLFSENLY